MTTNNWTPGPWAWFEAILKGRVKAAQLLIQPSAQTAPNDFTNIIAELPWQHFTVTEREANARLIASAPELVAALDGMCLAYAAEIAARAAAIDGDPVHIKGFPLLDAYQSALVLLARVRGEEKQG